ncbi:ABC transporter family protein (macronuclear) [Tetrahymena thermophila SB210]|uniref:ABC transporter family protein n=1 Tax=Tetrahymena thermophila (strain SB210) TaxID=312017 RepID=Q22MP1_TETTS|nr:ABC transporter family protein [Tetrahymena thermophila SB210]EAR86486.1 ABC transporter family protein [Tetrahymena thermophila SB210]|eukprot:XP_976979.1 ABC transporter family protein [Tetrahymena thermophila SB210]
MKQIQSIDIVKNYHVDITFKDLTYTVVSKKGEQKQLLKGVSGICKSGEVAAILGSSGAGKTTLLNVLSQRVSNTKTSQITGEIKANNHDYDSDKFSQFASYVMQDDILLETMTVKECITFAANLRIGGTPEQKELKVNEVIKNLNLERCQNTMIGGQFVKGISGGEKKRTSIGYELISDPACIFLDEPTSGLDSFTAYRIIHLLKQYAQNKNKTVVFTIHSPSSDIWSMFDNIMLLVDGRFIYQGKGNLDIIQHFSSIGFNCPKFSNPADYFISIMHSSRQQNVENYQVYFEGYNQKLKPIIYERIDNANQGLLPLKQTKTSFFYQAFLIAQRQAKIIARIRILSKARVIQSIVLGLFLGAVFWQIPGPTENPTIRDINDKNGILLFFSITIYMMQLQFCILTFPIQRPVFLREENAKLYTTAPYFIGQYLVDMVPAIIFPIITSLVAYWMIGLNDDNAGKVFFFILVAILASLSGQAFGYLTGSLINNPNVAVSLAPVLIKPFMLFAGLVKNGSDYASWISWFQYLSPFKYSFAALCLNEYDYDGPSYPQDPIHQLNFDMSKWQSVGGLIGCFSICTFVSFLFLLLQKKKLQ